MSGSGMRTGSHSCRSPQCLRRISRHRSPRGYTRLRCAKTFASHAPAFTVRNFSASSCKRVYNGTREEATRSLLDKTHAARNKESIVSTRIPSPDRLDFSIRRPRFSIRQCRRALLQQSSNNQNLRYKVTPSCPWLSTTWSRAPVKALASAHQLRNSLSVAGEKQKFTFLTAGPKFGLALVAVRALMPSIPSPSNPAHASARLSRPPGASCLIGVFLIAPPCRPRVTSSSRKSSDGDLHKSMCFASANSFPCAINTTLRNTPAAANRASRHCSR